MYIQNENVNQSNLPLRILRMTELTVMLGISRSSIYENLILVLSTTIQIFLNLSNLVHHQLAGNTLQLKNG